MFDIGFSELIVIAVVALVVIGPEKLPKVARTLGLLLGRAQRYVNDVKADIHREIHLDELKKLQTDVTDSARALENSVRKEVDTARNTFAAPTQSIVDDLEATARQAQTTAQADTTLEIGPPLPPAQMAPSPEPQNKPAA